MKSEFPFLPCVLHRLSLKSSWTDLAATFINKEELRHHPRYRNREAGSRLQQGKALVTQAWQSGLNTGAHIKVEGENRFYEVVS